MLKRRSRLYHISAKRIICFALVFVCCSYWMGCSVSRIDAVQNTRSPQITVFASATAYARPTPTPTRTPRPTVAPTPSVEERIWSFISGMTIQQKIGQLAMFGFAGADSVAPEFEAIIDAYQLGNVIFYGANVDRSDRSGGFLKIEQLVAALDEHNPCGIPRLYSIDVEGGSVHRFAWDIPLLSAYSLGSKDYQTAYDQFFYVAQRLRSVGINVDLAPVMDAAYEPLETFLGDRIISSDTAVVSEIGGGIIDGLHDGGCLATAKHFPGHGGTVADSHVTTPLVDKAIAELYSYDLVPFCAAVDKNVDCVLVAHILYPALDEEHIASMSNAIISGVLRGEMGFEGIVISDDFRMSGLTSCYTIEEAAVRFILSGGDIILCGANYEYQQRIMDALNTAATDGTLPSSRIDRSVFRILYAKYRLGIWEP